jgi:hypothetical protein
MNERRRDERNFRDADSIRVRIAYSDRDKRGDFYLIGLAGVKIIGAWCQSNRSMMSN